MYNNEGNALGNKAASCQNTFDAKSNPPIPHIMSTNTNNKNDGMFTLADGKSVLFTFALVSSLFLLWGFCNGMIDVMDKHFQDELHLTKSQSAWVQFAHYFGYFLMSVPAGWLASKLGYKGGIITGLLIVSLGGLWFIPATGIQELAKAGNVSPTLAFVGFLVGVCTIASGLTFLETIANPYTTVLGNPKFSATRINLAQSANGIGWIFGPVVGSIYFYSKNEQGVSTGSQTLYIPYVAIAVVAFLLGVVFFFARMPDVKAEDDYHLDDNAAVAARSIWTHPHFVLAVMAQFFYVAAQAGIFSFFINTMISDPKSGFTMVPAIPESWNESMNWLASHTTWWQYMHDWLLGWFEPKSGRLCISDKGAANLLSVGFVCFVTGRFVGTALVKKFSASTTLGMFAVANVIACLLIVLNLGWVSVVCVFLTFFFMSLMFPTIFALGIFGLGSRAKRASSFIVMAIMGGAILPKLMGYVGDTYNMSRSYLVPMACFAFVAIYGFCWPMLSKAGAANGIKTSGGH